MGQDKSPQAAGSPSGVSLNPRSSPGFCSQHPPPPNLKARGSAAGDVSPLKPLRAPKPLSQLPFPLFLQPVPPAPAAPGSPPASGRHNTPGSTRWGVQGLSGSSQLGRVPFLPQTSSGTGCSPHIQQRGTSPYPPLPRAPICPQDGPGHLGTGDHPSCWGLSLVSALGGAQGSLRWETPCEGRICQLLVSCMI